MASAITPSLRSSLERLKHSGAINGLCLGWRRQVLVNLLPYPDFRAERAMHMVMDARDHYNRNGSREVNCLWCGYEGVHLLAIFEEDCTLIMLHSRSSDVDFLTRVGATFLQDAHVLVNAALNPSGSDGDQSDGRKLHSDAPEEHPDEGTTGQTHLIPRSGT